MNEPKISRQRLDSEYSLLFIYGGAKGSDCEPQLNVEVLHGHAVIKSGTDLVHRVPQHLRRDEKVKLALKWEGWSACGSKETLKALTGDTAVTTPAQEVKHRLYAVREQKDVQDARHQQEVVEFKAYLKSLFLL